MKRIFFVFTFAYCFTVVTKAQNTLFVQDTTGHARDTLTINVNISNDSIFVAVQTDIQLPDQVSYLPGSAALTGRSNGHILSATLLNGNRLRLIAFSLSQSSFSGNVGAVAVFRIILGNQPGDYSINLVGPIISNRYSQNVLTNFSNGNLILLSPDINLNTNSLDFYRTPLGSYTDRTIVISNVGNIPLNIFRMFANNNYFQIIGDTSFSIAAFSSKTVSVRFNAIFKGLYSSQLTIQSDDPDEEVKQISLTATAFAVNELHLNNNSGRSGYPITISLRINNMERFVGFQFDIDLPPVLRYIQGTASLTSRKVDHLVSADTISTYKVRVISFSPTNNSFTGSEGDIVTLGFTLNGTGGNYNINLSNAIISDSTMVNIASDIYNGYVNIISPDLSGETNITFNEVAVLDTSIFNYRLNNYGNDTLLIMQFSSANNAFTNTTPLPQKIAPNSYSYFSLKFHSDQKGIYSSKYTVRSNDPDEDPFYIYALGTAFAPNYIIVRDTSTITGDTVTLKIDIDNFEQFVAVQLDIIVPDSLLYIANSAKLTNRKQDHILNCGQLAANKYRLIAFSFISLPFLGNNGTVIEMKFFVGANIGSHNLIISNAILSDSASVNILKDYHNGILKIFPVPRLNLTAVIEGFYDSQTNTITSDTILVQLRKPSFALEPVQEKKTVLNSTGESEIYFDRALNDTKYYLVLKHRNSIETWSKTGQSFTNSILNYDFTLDSIRAYGNNLKKCGSKWCIYSGDVNQDGFIDYSDLLQIDNDSYCYTSGYVNSDINGDQFVDYSDLRICENNSNNFVGVQKPEINMRFAPDFKK